MKTTIATTAILHESTVRNADDHTVKRRGRGKEKPKMDGPVEVVKVNPQVWAAVLRLADGDPRRIAIVSETECFVR